MAAQPTESSVLPGLGRTIALVAPADDSAALAWSMHHFDWPGRIAAAAACALIGIASGGLAGINVFPTLMMVALISGCLEGHHLGFYRSGWAGSFLRGLIDTAAGTLTFIGGTDVDSSDSDLA